MRDTGQWCEGCGTARCTRCECVESGPTVDDITLANNAEAFIELWNVSYTLCGMLGHDLPDDFHAAVEALRPLMEENH